MTSQAKAARLNRLLTRLAIGGLLVLVAGAVVSELGIRAAARAGEAAQEPSASAIDWSRVESRIWNNLFVVAFYLLTLGLGGAVFLALASVAGAGWHVAFRRVPEALTKLIPVAGVALLIVVAVNTSAYQWHHHGDGDAGTFWFKELWLSSSFWFARSAAYVVIWSLMAAALVARSRSKERTGSGSGSVGLSALFLAVFAVTFSLASVDWLMALQPLWFSTIWGVYHFSGMFQAALAVIVLLGLALRTPGGPLEGVFRDDHLHDLGKLLMGFSCFWMYIWFSQYMLIWYSNIPEETSYFIVRTRGAWGPVVLATIILNWVVPFFVLLPRPAKRSAGVMAKVAVIVLIGRWLDLYLMVAPVTSPGPSFGLWEAAAVSLLVGSAATLLLRAFSQSSPVPQGDPYLAESLHYHT